MSPAEELFKSQKDFFAAGSTAMPDARLAALYCLNDTIENGRPMLEMLLRADYKGGEAVTAEISTVLEEQARWQKELLRLLRSGWKKEEGGKPAPAGTVLLMGAPGACFLQNLCALFAAAAAGNTVVMNLERTASATADCLRTLLQQTFEPEYITVSDLPSAELTALPFDKVFDVGAATEQTLFGRDGLRLFSQFGSEDEN